MAIDPRISLAVQTPDIAGAYTGALEQGRKNMLLAREIQQRDLELEKKNRFAQAYSAAYDPQTKKINQNALVGTLAQSGLGDLIPEVEKQFASQQEAELKNKAAQLEFSVISLRNAREEIAKATSKTDAVAIAKKFVASGALSAENAAELEKEIPDDPNQFKTWIRSFSTRLQSVEQQRKQELDEARVANERGQLGVAQANLGLRSRELGLSERRFAYEQNKPTQTAATLKPLTAAQDAALRGRMSKDFTAAQTIINNALDPKSGIAGAVDAVRKLTPSQKATATGIESKFYSITPSARDADRVLKNLEGKVTEMGKAATAATGAIGSMAVQEWEILRNTVANLDFSRMTPKGLEEQLNIIEARAKRIAELTQRAYEDQYMEEFDRYPGRFELRVPTATQAPRDGGVDQNNPLLKERK